MFRFCVPRVLACPGRGRAAAPPALGCSCGPRLLHYGIAASSTTTSSRGGAAPACDGAAGCCHGFGPRRQRRTGGSATLCAAAGPSAAGAPGGSWSEQDFVELQKPASVRLHRFYVPQPLGSAHLTAPSDPLLEALLPALLGPAAGAPAAAAPPASPPTTSGRNSGAGGSARSQRSSPASRAAPEAVAVAPAAAAAAAAGSAAAAAGSAAWVPPTVVLEGEEARHAARALRLQAGDRVELCDGVGHVVGGTVTGVDKARVWVSPDGPAAYRPWVGSRWVAAVACTTLKGGRAEVLAEKLTELGAYGLVPLVTERSQAGGKAKFRTRGGSDGGDADGGEYAPGRLERVAVAATKQSLRAHALRLAPPTPLDELLPLVRKVSQGGAQQQQQQDGAGAGAGAGGIGGAGGGGQEGAGGASGGAAVGQEFCLVAAAGAPSLAEVLRGVGGVGGAVGTPTRVLVVGPEGDFSPRELAALTEAGALPVGLGDNRLRTETAAIGLLAACLFAGA